MGAISVAWHADSSLQDSTCISVYVAQHSAEATNFELPPAPPRPVSSQPRPWRLALRVVHDAEGPAMRASGGAPGRRDHSTPALLVPLLDGDSYHMLGDFNHNHQHAVIQPASLHEKGAGAGAGGDRGEVRYSSTHRVAVEEGATFRSVQRRALKAVAAAAEEAEGAASTAAATFSVWAEEQECLDALEFEWLRQWYVQGAAHRDSHPWWASRMAALEDLWLALERLTLRRVAAIRAAANGPRKKQKGNAPGAGGAREGGEGGAAGHAGANPSALAAAAAALHAALARRQRLRNAWAERERDPIFDQLDEGYRPMPCLHAAASGGGLAGTLPGELTPIVEELGRLLQSD
jgi:hypothetical protein